MFEIISDDDSVNFSRPRVSLRKAIQVKHCSDHFMRVFAAQPLKHYMKKQRIFHLKRD